MRERERESERAYLNVFTRVCGLTSQNLLVISILLAVLSLPLSHSSDFQWVVVILRSYSWQVVREVHYSRNGVSLKTEDHCVYNAKYVILSVSVGVLQSELITFSPPLPVKSLSLSLHTHL